MIITIPARKKSKNAVKFSKNCLPRWVKIAILSRLCTRIGGAIRISATRFTFVDDGDIFIGDNVMLAPNVVIATAGHPIEPNLRKKAAQFNMPVRIERNVWVGAGAVILPGVTIGENSVIGAGSVVTKDIPKNSVAYGNPCRVVREINEHDREYYYKNRKIDIE